MEIALILLVIAAVFVVRSIKSRAAAARLGGRAVGKYHATPHARPELPGPIRRSARLPALLKEIPLDVPSQVCITKDNTQLTVDGILYFQVTDPMRASYGASNYVVAITQLAQTTLRSVIGRMELDKTFEERDSINSAGASPRRGSAATGASRCCATRSRTSHHRLRSCGPCRPRSPQNEKRADRRVRRPPPGADQYCHRRAGVRHRQVRR